MQHSIKNFFFDMIEAEFVRFCADPGHDLDKLSERFDQIADVVERVNFDKSGDKSAVMSDLDDFIALAKKIKEVSREY